MIAGEGKFYSLSQNLTVLPAPSGREPNPLSHGLRRASSPEGGAFGHLPVSANKAPPSGELANAVSLRGFVPRKRPRPLRHRCAMPPLPKGEPLAVPANFISLPRPLPLRKDFPRSGGRCRAATKGGVWHGVSRDGEGEDANRSAALSQKAVLQLPFLFTTPPVKIAFGAARRPRQTRNLKYFFR